MTVYHIQYNEPDGEIHIWDNSDEPVLHGALTLLTIERDVEPDMATEKVVGGALVPKTNAERQAAAAPQMAEVQAAVIRELVGTDSIVAQPDRPPPKGTTRDAWISYRQALRDLSKPQGDQERLPTPAEMIAAWPLRPNGADAIPHLRSRLQD